MAVSSGPSARGIVVITHGAHLFWDPVKRQEVDIFNRIYQSHLPGEDGTPGEPLVRFGPDVPPTLVDGLGRPWTTPSPPGR